MSSLIFGSTISIATTATPSSGWLVGYDTDGKLKQKDEFGIITDIVSVQSLSDTLLIDNSTELYSIIMGTSTSIRSINSGGQIDLDFAGVSNSVLISNDIGNKNDAGFYLQTGYSEVFTNKQSVELNQNLNYIAIYNKDGGQITLGVDSSSSTNYNEIDEIKIGYNSITSTSTANTNKQSVFIATKNSQIASGVVNTVILGGDTINANNSNSVYTSDLYPIEIKSDLNTGVFNLSDVNNDLIIDRNNGLKDTAWFRISESETNYNYWSELIVNSSIGLTSGILIQNKDILNNSNLTSLKLEKDSLSLLTDGPTYSINFIINSDLNKAEIQGNSEFKGLEYNSDFSASYSVRSLVDKNYVDTLVSSVSIPNIYQVLSSNNNTQTRSLIMGTQTYIKSKNGGGRIDLDFGGSSNNVLISTDDSAKSTSYIQLNNSNIEILSSFFDITLSDNKITTTNGEGLKYATDYSSGYVNRSLVDKNYVDVGTSSIWSSIQSAVSGTGSVKYIPYWISSSEISSTSSISLSSVTTKNTIESTINVGTTPYNSKINNDKLYVANFGSDNISVIDLTTNLITATISVGTNPSEIIVDKTTNYIWVSNRGSNSVNYINSTTNTVVGSIPVGTLPFGVIKVEEYIYVANQGSNNISIIDTNSNLITATISISTPRNFAYDEVNNYLWVTGVGPDYVGIVDLKSNLIIGSVSVGANPYSAAYDMDNEYVYITNYSSNSVSVIDTQSQLVIATVSVGTNPDGIVHDGNNAKIYVSNYTTANISVIDHTTVVETFSIAGGNGRGLEYDNLRGKIYLSNSTAERIEIIETISRQQDFVGINTSFAKTIFDVNGKITTNSLRIIDGAHSGYVLVSDSGGNANWFSGLRAKSTGGFEVTEMQATSETGTSFAVMKSDEITVASNSSLDAYTRLSADGRMYMKGSSLPEVQLRSTNVTNPITLEFPDKSTGTYTIATIDTTTAKYTEVRSFTDSVTETINHNLGTEDLIIQAYNSTGEQIIPGIIQLNGTNDVDITFNDNLSNVKIVIIG